jgi:DNA transformation protein
MMKGEASDSQLNEFIEALSGLGAVHTKRFFGGTALMHGTTLFAYYVKGDLYFRVDDSNRGGFEDAGSVPFQYRQSNGKTIIVKAFCAVPEFALDDRDELCRLARDAIEAGLRIDRTKSGKTASRR